MLKVLLMFRIPAGRLRTLSCLLLAGAALLPSSALHAEEAGTLTVTLRNVRDASGSVRAGLYRDPATFRKEDRAVSVAQAPATPEQTIVTFRDLPPGRYAIMAYHDENGDGTLNRRFGMFPTEGYGLSNNPQVSGPPAFEDSAFEVAVPETAISIDLRY
ncbi:MAG: hypothetical protein QG616_1278 [Pseudomonadota bacterium]|nr:hypothetical protein [Pseudomonadota bacterium]MDQ5945363.1 hypothetical protein [Pseudomonadota bacterium]